MSRRSRGARLVATLLLAAASLSLVPRPAVAEHRCHSAAPHQVVAAAQGCGDCAQASCVAMSGCGHVVAVITAAPAGPSMLSNHLSTVSQTPIARDLASLGPPTPPPNS